MLILVIRPADKMIIENSSTVKRNSEQKVVKELQIYRLNAVYSTLKCVGLH
jgi:hypothetical protein